VVRPRPPGRTVWNPSRSPASEARAATATQRHVTEFETSPGLPRGFAFAAGMAAPIALRPTGLVAGAAGAAMAAAGTGRRLGGGKLVFTACEAFLHGAAAVTIASAPLEALCAWAAAEGAPAADAVPALLTRLATPPPPFAAIPLDRPRIVGIVNTSPDSFHADSAFADAAGAIDHGTALAAAGADIVDVGGESSRPGARPTSEAAELARVVPVVRGLASAGIVVSVDTRRAAVMREAIAVGARIVNDITALAGEADALAVVADSGASVVLMHMQGTPDTMQDDPRYAHAPYEIYRALEARVAACEAAGIPRERIAVDPGIGFGKTVEHNLEILNRLDIYGGLGLPVLLGVSRKSFIAQLSRNEAPKDRVPGSLAAVLAAWAQGVRMFRVHDVAETRQALAVAQAIGES